MLKSNDYLSINFLKIYIVTHMPYFLYLKKKVLKKITSCYII